MRILKPFQDHRKQHNHNEEEEEDLENLLSSEVVVVSSSSPSKKLETSIPSAAASVAALSTTGGVGIVEQEPTVPEEEEEYDSKKVSSTSLSSSRINRQLNFDVHPQQQEIDTTKKVDKHENEFISSSSTTTTTTTQQPQDQPPFKGQDIDIHQSVRSIISEITTVNTSNSFNEDPNYHNNNNNSSDNNKNKNDNNNNLNVNEKKESYNPEEEEKKDIPTTSTRSKNSALNNTAATTTDEGSSLNHHNNKQRNTSGEITVAISEEEEEQYTLATVTIDSTNTNTNTNHNTTKNTKNSETKKKTQAPLVQEEDGVVFMGWKNNTDTSDSTKNNNTAVYQSPSSASSSSSNMKKATTKKASSAPERNDRQKKNIWQGMLSSKNARWRSPIQQQHKKKIPTPTTTPVQTINSTSGGKLSIDGKRDSHDLNAITTNTSSEQLEMKQQQQQLSPMAIAKTVVDILSPKNDDIPNIVNEVTSNTTITTHNDLNTNNDAGMGTFITPKKSKKNIVDEKDDTNNQTMSILTDGPISPPPLRFTTLEEQQQQLQVDKESKRNIDSSTNNFVGVVSATPTNKQRKKPFGRGKNHMKIQSKSLKPSGSGSSGNGGVGGGGGDQSCIMNDDLTMQKEFVQIKPFHRYLEGFQMSDSELYQEMMRKSNNVEILESTQLVYGNEQDECTSSTERQRKSPIGTLKVELLSCMGLPQIRRSKPNAIGYIVCGDNAFATDIIQSSLSPMWPARAKRAVCFPIFHAYARLYTGIFSVTDKEHDDYIGRSVVDIATLRPNTDYDVALPLLSSGTVYDPKPRGVVRLRFHLTWTQPSAAFLSYIPSAMNEVFVDRDESADLVTIPCAEPKSSRNVAYTVHGEDLPGKYSKKAFRAINRELNLYKFQTPMAFKRTLVHLMTYEKPFASGYLFIGWMAILYYRLYHLVPSYIVSIALLIHIINYFDLALNSKINSGFEPLSANEIFNTMVNGSLPEARTTKPPHSQCYDLESYLKMVGDLKIPLEDSLAFPFAETKYARPTLKSMLCPKGMHFVFVLHTHDIYQI